MPFQTSRGPRLPTLRSKPRPPDTLSEPQIVLAALDLIRRQGADRFSMRLLAKELGVTPMAIYYYVGNKDALFERLGDAVLARVPRPVPSGVNWREELKACAICGWQLLSEYPGLSAQIVKRPPTQQRDELTRYGVSILVAAGFEANSAYPAIATCNAFMFGMIGAQAHVERTRGNGRRVRPEASPVVAAIDVRFLVEWGLDAVLSGLGQQLVRRRSSAARVPAPKRARRAALKA
jgi:AcrR family transcriptional regulator